MINQHIFIKFLCLNLSWADHKKIRIRNERQSMENKTKTKKRITVIVIAAAAMIIVAVAIYIRLAPKTVSGNWELIVNPEISRATPDETGASGKVYYSFSKPDDTGKGDYRTYFDSGVETGTYELSEKGNRRYINMGTEDLEYTVTGLNIPGMEKLTVTYPEKTDEQTDQTTPAQDYIFVRSEAPDYEKESYSSYHTDVSLLGKWTTDERTLSYYVYDLSYDETVNFKDNGIMTIHYESADLALDRELYYAYSAEDGTLSFSPVTDKETVYTVKYGFDGGKVLLFKDDNTSASIFADAFFSDFSYKKAE